MGALHPRAVLVEEIGVEERPLKPNESRIPLAVAPPLRLRKISKAASLDADLSSSRICRSCVGFRVSSCFRLLSEPDGSTGLEGR